VHSFCVSLCSPSPPSYALFKYNSVGPLVEVVEKGDAWQLTQLFWLPCPADTFSDRPPSPRGRKEAAEAVRTWVVSFCVCVGSCLALTTVCLWAVCFWAMGQKRTRKEVSKKSAGVFRARGSTGIVAAMMRVRGWEKVAFVVRAFTSHDRSDAPQCQADGARKGKGVIKPIAKKGAAGAGAGAGAAEAPKASKRLSKGERKRRQAERKAAEVRAVYALENRTAMMTLLGAWYCRRLKRQQRKPGRWNWRKQTLVRVQCVWCRLSDLVGAVSCSDRLCV